MNKYNEWCHRKPLISNSDFTDFANKSAKINFQNISRFSKAALQQHEFLKINGIEFVAFSNIKIDKVIKLDNGLELHPCFYEQLAGHKIDDAIYKASFLMTKRARFLYDGWLPIENWTIENIANELRKIDEFISLFSMTGHIYFTWFPKYFYEENNIEVIHADTSIKERTIVDTSVELYNLLDKLTNTKDRNVIFKSINWINKAKETNDTIIKFLFYTLSIEQLAKYVENSKSNSSLYKIRTHKDKGERKEWKKDCLKKILNTIDYDKKPWVTIDKAYFECNSGLKDMIKRQIKRAFKPDSYLQKIEIDEIYSIRSKIAHGEIDTLNKDEIEFIDKKIYDIKKLAVNYVLSILYKCDINYPNEKLHASFGTDFENSFLSNASMYKGPTHMALKYFTMI